MQEFSGFCKVVGSMGKKIEDIIFDFAFGIPVGFLNFKKSRESVQHPSEILSN